MATYAVKYELPFSDTKGNTRLVQILKKDYTDAVLPLIGTDQPCIIKYSAGDDFYTPIIGSTCIINIATTDDTSYDEFMIYDEKEYKIRVSAGSTTDAIIESPEWETIDENWEVSEEQWDAGEGTLQVYWEGFLVADTYKEFVMTNPTYLTIRAIDNLGVLSGFLVPDASINLNADETIDTGVGKQTNLESGFYYIVNILKQTGLEFDIYFQNEIRGIFTPNDLVYKVLFFNEFSNTNDFAKKNSKEVLENILRTTNSRIYQANASWYVVSNSNYFDTRIDVTAIGAEQETENTRNPTVRTDDITNLTNSSITLNGTITDDANLVITERGFLFGENPVPIKNAQVVSSDTSSSFTYSATGLVRYTTYYITAYAKGGGSAIGFGDTISVVIDSTTSEETTQDVAPAVDPPTFTLLTDTTVTLNGYCSSVGTSDVTEYGFYFGTNGTSYQDNTKITITATKTGAFSFTSARTGLTAGITYYCNAWAKNTTGETVSQQSKDKTSETITTYNVWGCRKVADSSFVYAQYLDTKAKGDEVTLTDDGSECYVIIDGAIISDPGSKPTISGNCSTSVTPENISIEASCKEITLFGHTSVDNLCCKDPTAKSAWINADTFADATIGYIENTCTTKLATNNYYSEDLVNYRKFNGTAFETLTSCPACDDEAVNNYMVLQADNDITVLKYAALNEAYGYRVTIAEDGNCYNIIQRDYNPHITFTATINGTCTTATPTKPRTGSCPTMEYFGKYITCGDDVEATFGNPSQNFPTIVKRTSDSQCFIYNSPGQNIGLTDSENLACANADGSLKFEIDFTDCATCSGVTEEGGDTEQYVAPVVVTPTDYFRVYQSLNVCSADDGIINIKHTENSFPSVITDGNLCYSNLQAGGNGAYDLADYTEKSDCTVCNTDITGLVTTQPTTTVTPIVSFTAFVTSTAIVACCHSLRSDKAVTIYADNSNFDNANAVFTNSLGTLSLTPNYYIRLSSGNDVYFWNGYTITKATCPACP
jgi:hypothetical protein